MRYQPKQYISVFNLVLVTAVVFTLSTSAAANPSDPPLHPTLYVGCEYHYGSLKTIQAAVDAAGGGYTIQVCEGTYTENVNVNDATAHGSPPFNTFDGLQIVAEGDVKLRCPVSLAGSGFDLHANSITISGFDISKCASAISVEATYGGEQFKNNSLHNNTVGISFNSSSGDNSVIANAIQDNSGDGVFDYVPRGDSIVFNQVHGNGSNGIEISSTSNSIAGGGTCYLTSAVIQDNDVTNNVNDGVYLNHADCGQVKRNELSKNGVDGLQLNTSDNSVVTANDADKNGNDGIELSSLCTLNSLVDNRMQRNKVDAADHGSGNTWTNDHCRTTSGAAVCVPE